MRAFARIAAVTVTAILVSAWGAGSAGPQSLIQEIALAQASCGCPPRGPCEIAVCNNDGTCSYAPLASGPCTTTSDNPCEQACDGTSPYCQPLCTGNDCPGGNTCCAPGYCKNLVSDVSNCGSCGHACPTVANGYPVCSSSVCSIACNSGYCYSSGACVSTLTSSTNCGTCGHVCSSTAPTCCSGGCTNLSSDPRNCGACGRACSSTQTCQGGVCTNPPPPSCTCPYGRQDCCGDCTICRSSCSGVICP